MIREILSELNTWQAAGKPAALATVVNTWGSSPRPAGSHMVVNSDGAFAGSVSGGCVETAVIETALEVIASGKAQQLEFGVADETAWEVGLACGGQIEIIVSPIDWKGLSPILENILQDQPTWYQITLDFTGEISFSDALHAEQPTPHLDTTTSPARLILYAPPSRKLMIIGGVNIAQELTKFAKMMDYQVIIADPRRAFANQQRFPQADLILAEWPEEAFSTVPVTTSTAIAILTHDDKIDLPAMQQAVSSPAFYIGALGSTRTFARRAELLRQAGVSEQQIARIHGPIGLKIHAVTPQEIALSIIAEITAISNQKR
ncbi:XdhC family protein [bacterium]|nr:XdhC family protein [bacterium]